jgi:hypothetical protein
MAKDISNETPAAPIAELVKQLQAIGDYEKRKAFYQEHPKLQAIISPINFP